MVPLKAKTPVILVEDCGVIVVEPMLPVVLTPSLVAVNTRLSPPKRVLLVTVTIKLVLPPVMTALVPVKLVDTGPSWEINWR